MRMRSMIRSALMLLLLALLALTPAMARGMTAEDVTKLRSVTSAKMSPDGKHVAFLVSVPRDPYDDDDGSAWTELHVAYGPGKSRPFVHGKVNVSGIAWSANGGAIFYRAKRHGDEHTAVYKIPVDGGESTKVASFDTSISSFDISADGKRIAFIAKAKEDKAEKKMKKKGFKAKVVEEQLRFSRVWVAEFDGGPVDADDAKDLDLGISASALRFSPNGKQLAVAGAPTPLIDDRYMKTKLRIVNLEGRTLGEVDNPGKLGDFIWSPDGQALALISAADLNDPNAGRLMVAAATGGQPLDLFRGLLADIEFIEWKDRSTLAFVIDKGTESAYAEVGSDGGDYEMHLDYGGPSWAGMSHAADGKRAAFVANTAEHPGELYVYDGSKATRWTDHNPWLADIELARQESITWKARDGKEIEGVLNYPLNYKKGKRYPMIHVVHGGPESHYSNGWNTNYSRPGQVAAAQGYVVLHANYRGSTGRGVEFSKASQADYAGDITGKKGGEFLDLVDAIDHLVNEGLVDRKKVGITGASYGGFASAWGATAHSEHYAASVMFVGISDQISKFGTTDIPNEMFLVHARRWPWDYWDWFMERSPIKYIEQAKTPILIMHGEDDTRVHPSQSMELYRYLKTVGNVPVRLVLYPGEGHGNRKAAARYDYSLRLMRWMNHYLKGPGGDPPAHELELDSEKLGVKED